MLRRSRVSARPLSSLPLTPRSRLQGLSCPQRRCFLRIIIIDDKERLSYAQNNTSIEISIDGSLSVSTDDDDEDRRPPPVTNMTTIEISCHGDALDTDPNPNTNPKFSKEPSSPALLTFATEDAMEEKEGLLTRYAAELAELKLNSRFFAEHRRQPHPEPKFKPRELEISALLGVGGFCTESEGSCLG